MLYLGAEAAGVRGTGIGCFYDDVMHRALGLADRTWQSLYHFTIGGPLEDPRLVTLPPYAHLASRSRVAAFTAGRDPRFPSSATAGNLVRTNARQPTT
jgi:hypothetical protein